MRAGWCFLAALLLVFTACAGVPKRPPDAVSELDRDEAARLVRAVKEKNNSIAPYKGIGQIAIHGKRGSMDGRAAWIAAPDGRFRVEALAVTGQPFARMICTKDECFFIYRDGDCLRKQSAGDAGFEPLSGVELNAGDMVMLMGGGAALADHDNAGAYAAGSGQKVLVLKRRLMGTVQTVRFSEDLEHILEVRVFGWRGLKYRAEIMRLDRAGSRMIPFELNVSDAGGNSISVSVERCWFDIEPKEAAFSHELPEGTGCGLQ